MDTTTLLPLDNITASLNATTADTVDDYYYYYDADAYFRSLDRFVTVFVCGAIGVAVNGVVVVGMVAWRRAMKRKHALIINQAITDLLCCVSVLASYAVYISFDGRLSPDSLRDQFICRFIINESIFWTLSNASTFNIMLIGLERYAMLVCPLQHRQHASWWTSGAAVAAPWLAAFLVNIPYALMAGVSTTGWCFFYGWPAAGVKAYAVLYCLVTFCLPLLVLIYSYACIVKTLLRRGARVGATPPRLAPGGGAGAAPGNRVTGPGRDGGHDDAEPTARKPDRRPGKGCSETIFTITGGTSGSDAGQKKTGNPKREITAQPAIPRPMTNCLPRAHVMMTKTMLVVSIIYVVCLLPYQIWYMLHQLVPLPYDETTYVTLVALTTLNNCLNPLIYATKLRKRRKTGGKG